MLIGFEIGIKKVVIMKNKPENAQYCMFTGECCSNCRKCDHIPQNVIVNNMPSNNSSSKLVVVLLLVLIVALLIILMPYVMMNSNNDLMKEPIHNFDTNSVHLSNYESQNSYGGSEVQNYYNNPLSSTSSSGLFEGYVLNTSGEAYNSMG